MPKLMVFRYGLLPPVENEAVVRAQMLKAHTYRNTLVEIERGRRAAERALLATRGDVYALEKAAADATALEEAAAKAVTSARSSSRKRDEPQELKDALKAAREAKTAAVAALKAYRKTVREDPEVVAARDTINDRAAELRRSAREHCGVYWGTYLRIEAAAEASFGDTPLYAGALPSDPEFARWKSEGAVEVQIQQQAGKAPFLCEHVFGNDTRLRVDPVKLEAWWSPSRAERRKAARTMLRLRVSSEGRAPVWAAWPMIMHRELPKGSIVKRVAVHCDRRAGTVAELRSRGQHVHKEKRADDAPPPERARREEWYATFTVELSSEGSGRRCGEGAVAVDLGWRQMGDEVRVAAWRGEDGRSGELRLDADTLGKFLKAEDLRSIRDKNFNEARDVLVAWLRDREVPAWLTEATATLAHWRSPARLATLTLRWKKNRFAGDEEVFGRIPTKDEARTGIRGPGLEGWWRQDYHLWTYEGGKRIRARRHRREVYRKFASDLAGQYGTLVLEAFNLRPLVRRQAPGGEAENEVARTNRHRSAVSELRECLSNAFSVRGGDESRQPPEFTTITCNVCGLVDPFDAAAMIFHKCSGCGTLWDQDDNAAENLLQRWFKALRERPDGASEVGSARKDENKNKSKEMQESRWVRAARLKKEKDARRGTAREGCAKTAE